MKLPFASNVIITLVLKYAFNSLYISINESIFVISIFLLENSSAKSFEHTKYVTFFPNALVSSFNLPASITLIASLLLSNTS